MKRLILYLFVSGILSVFASVPGKPQDLQTRFEQLSVEHGLSQGTVYCLFQDSRGFLWAGTGDGLNRYDGEQFKIFRHSDKPQNAISGNRIFALAGDSSGAIWVATEKGIDEYLVAEGKFLHPDFCNNFRNQKQSEYLAAIYPEFGDNFVFSNASMLFSYNRRLQKLFTIDLTGVFSIEKYNRDTLLVTTFNGVYFCRIDERGIHLTQLKLRLPRHVNIRCIAPGSSGALWIGTLQDGLFKYTIATDVLVQYARKNNKFPSDNVSALLTDNATGLWVGTMGSGLVYLDGNSGATDVYSTKNTSGLLSNYIGTLYRDVSHVLWIGTDGGGLSKFVENKDIFKDFSSQFTGEFSMKGKFIRSVSQDKEGTLYIAALENGLYVLNDRLNIRKHFRPPSPLFGNSTEIIAAFVDQQNSLWVGTEKKLFKFSADFKTQAAYDIYKLGAWLECGDKLLIGTSIGLFCYHYKTGEIKPVLFRDGSGVLTNRWVRALHQLPDGTIVVGTIGAGVAAFDTKSESLVGYHPGQTENFALPNPNVISFSADPVEPEKYFWAGTRAGLFQIELSNGKITGYTTLNGLVNEYIYGILPDRNGYLWLSTNNGLIRFNSRKKTFKNYSKSDGLQSLEFNTGAEVILPDGKMLFGGTTGLTIFDPAQVELNKHVPTIVLTEFKVFDIPYQPGMDYSTMREITLTADQNIFAFKFAALDLADPAKNQFAYMMEGFEKQWSYCGSAHEIRYTGLKPGTYHFRVKGSNNHDVWNEAGMEIIVHIQPPFWQTWWFRIFASIFLLTAISLEIWHLQTKKYRKRVAQLERQNEIEKERARIARDMHDEIGAILTRISILTDIEKNNTSEKQTLVGQIGEASREAVDSIGEIIWALNPKNDTLADLVFYLRRYAAEYFQNSPVEVHITLPDQIPELKLRSQMRRDLFLFVKETLQNILKHAKAVNVRFTIFILNNTLELVIEDDGKGFDEAQLTRRGNGLLNLRRRAADLHGECTIQSSPGMGARTTLLVPLNDDTTQ